MNYENAEKALNYLHESEEEYARLKAGHQAEKERLKIIKAGLELEAPEATAAGKTRWAEAHKEYLCAVEDWEEFMESFYLVEAKRKRAELSIEIWRSVNAAQKRGNI